MRSPITNNPMVQSPVLLQPQNLHHLTRQNIDTLEAASASKPRSYSASSEMLLNTFNQQLQQPQMRLNHNTRALVGSPIHQYQKYAQQQRPQQRPRAASSSSMLHESIQYPVPTRIFHPYQHLPGASLSLQMLNKSATAAASNGNNGSCVYLRPEQNIPEVFANPGTVFKPIDEVDNGSDVNDNNEMNRGEGGAISRDDIVVTMRSVNV